MRIVLSSIVAFFLINMSSLKAQTAKKIKSAYGEIFKIEKKQYKKRTYYHKYVAKLPKDHFLAKTVNSNKHYLSYLLSNFTSFYKGQFADAQNAEQMQQLFVKALSENAEFNQIMGKFFQRTVKQTNVAPDTVTTSQLMNIAVKYFNIRKVNAKGQYTLKVCGGLNGISQTEAKRQPQLEAFCFSTILKNYMNRKSGLQKEVIKKARQLYAVNLGIDKKDRLFRAQGALFLLMFNSDVLKNLMLKEYEAKKGTLPFVIKNNKS